MQTHFIKSAFFAKTPQCKKGIFALLRIRNPLQKGIFALLRIRNPLQKGIFALLRIQNPLQYNKEFFNP
ncbi:MAG: hypothetical protein BWK80_59865 [Desulfobacteraceae bacterium IS3]|nr:MAG: hypothetical protein BWK80_59865 [Desulfobacteraceae bacterium IS3]